MITRSRIVARGVGGILVYPEKRDSIWAETFFGAKFSFACCFFRPGWAGNEGPDWNRVNYYETREHPDCSGVHI